MCHTECRIVINGIIKYYLITFSMDTINIARISVDLTQFYQDYRRFCWVHLDHNRMRTVNDLKTYLLNIFHIGGKSELMLDDCLLLGETDLKILRDGDHICLIDSSKYQPPTSDNSATSAAFVGDSSKPLSSSEENEKETQNSGTERANKKKKKKAPSSPNTEAVVNSKIVKEVEVAKDTACVVQTPKKNKKKDEIVDKNQGVGLPDQNGLQNGLLPTDEATNEEMAAPAVQDEVDWSSFPLPKRKRTRKHRKKNKIPDTTTAMPLGPIPTHSVPPVIHHPQRLHIRFDERIEEASYATNQSDLEVPMITEPVTPSTSLPTMAVKPKVQQQDFSELLLRKKPIVFELKPSTLALPSPQTSVEPDNSYWDSITETQIWNSTISGVNPFIRDSEGKFEMEGLTQEQQDKMLVINWQDLMATRILNTPTTNGIHLQ
ncbi:hypothetical protein B566_EDAN015588 [Ephemera danica]|nr:hypothetical protein B566_EDAN015588 [Ephemera danica]